MRSAIKTLAVGALTVGALVAAPAAFAADSVTQAVTSGSRTASVADASLQSVATSHSITNGTGSLSLNVDDLSGTGVGWHVTEEVSAFVYSGSNDGTNIPAANFAVTPGTVTGNGGASTTGLTVGSAGTLDSPVTVLSAAAGSGVGNYTQALAASLTVPADSRAGTYTGTLTTTITAAP
ncbi:WxL domain-containing protein [bacterium RCC_150]